MTMFYTPDEEGLLDLDMVVAAARRTA